MPEDPAGQTETKTFTQDEVEALIKERNKALEMKRDELLGEVRGLKDKLHSAEEGFSELQARLATLEEEQKAKEANVNSEKLEEIRRTAEANLEKKYGPLKTELEQAHERIRTLQLDNVVKQAMGKSGVRGERVDALFKLTADRFDLTDDGKPMLRDDPTTPIDQYIADTLGKEYPELFVGTGSSGGGAPKPAASGGGTTVISADDNMALLDEATIRGIARGEISVAQPE